MRQFSAIAFFLTFVIFTTLSTTPVHSHPLPAPDVSTTNTDNSPPSSLQPRYWRKPSLPVSAGTGRRPPPIVQKAPTPTEQAKARQAQVETKKTKYANIRVGRAFVNQVLKGTAPGVIRSIPRKGGADGASTSGTKKPGQ